MREMKRAIHLDFHTMPGIDDFNRDWDPEEFAQILHQSHVKYINAFAKCNLGFAYYPTKIGIPYPNMKGDMFGDLLRECHKKDIGVTAYYNVGLDHEQARQNRHWCVLNKEGQVIYGDRTGNFFRNMCYNTEGYRKYILGMIKEGIDNYDIDGLFLDCMGLFPCYGNECLEDIVKEGLDPFDDRVVSDHTKRVMEEFSRQVKKMLGNDKYLYLNGMPYREVQDLDTHVEIECLPGAWSYDYFAAQAAYARNIQKKVLYMTGRFQKSWGDFGGLKSKASLEYDVWDGISNGLDVSIGDHMHPAENLDKTVYGVVGEIFKDVAMYEPWTQGARYVADVGVITDSGGFLNNSYKGISRMLGELKMGFDIVNEDMDLTGYQVLIIPDELTPTKVLKKKIGDHIREGKGVLSSGFGGVCPDSGFVLPRYNFIYDGPDQSSSSYFTVEDDENFSSMKWAMYSHGILMREEEGANIVASYIKPYFNKHWDGFHGYFYTPWKRETCHRAALNYENIYHICFKIFEAYYECGLIQHKKLVEKCLKNLLNPTFKCKDIPSTARVTMTKKAETVQIHVKVTYPEVRGEMDIIEEHGYLKGGSSVYVKGRYGRVYVAPHKEKLRHEYDGEYTRIFLPEIWGYMMVVCEK